MAEDEAAPMDVDVADEAGEEKNAADEVADAGGEAPNQTQKSQKKAAAPPAEAPVVTGKRQRKSVDFFVPDAPVRDKKPEKPKEVRRACEHAGRHHKSAPWSVMSSCLQFGCLGWRILVGLCHTAITYLSACAERAKLPYTQCIWLTDWSRPLSYETLHVLFLDVQGEGEKLGDIPNGKSNADAPTRVLAAVCSCWPHVKGWFKVSCQLPHVSRAPCAGSTSHS